MTTYQRPKKGARGLVLVGNPEAIENLQAIEIPAHAEAAIRTVRLARGMTAAATERLIFLANRIAGLSESGEPQSWSNEDADELARLVLKLAGS